MFKDSDKKDMALMTENAKQFTEIYLKDFTDLAGKLKVSFIEIVHFIINIIDPMAYRRMKLSSPASYVISLYQDTIYNFTKYKNNELWT
jgi:hypothetical protein